MAVWTDPQQDQEAIWDLKYHQFQDLLLSLNASNSVVLWDCSSIKTNGGDESNSNGIIRHRFQHSSAGGSEEKATCMTWLLTVQHQFVVGYDSGLIVFFEVLNNS